jgi:mono/diheme cytochrome c family protein
VARLDYTIYYMSSTRLVLVTALALAFVPALCAESKVERGKYIVEDVGACADCHTPRGADGQLDRSKWLKGAVLNFQPIEPIKGWHKTSPDLTPGSRLFLKWGEKGLIHFLETGLGPNGNKADPPMPAYHLTSADAEAVVEYLKSLK